MLHVERELHLHQHHSGKDQGEESGKKKKQASKAQVPTVQNNKQNAPSLPKHDRIMLELIAQEEAAKKMKQQQKVNGNVSRASNVQDNVEYVVGKGGKVNKKK